MTEDLTDLNDFSYLAERADRAMRTFSARNTAESSYEMVQNALLSAEAVDVETRILNALEHHRGWKRKNDREFVCTFGDRSCTLNVPRPFERQQLTRLITRIEVNVFLGGQVDDALMRELQSLGQRELQRLFDLESQPA
jgi:hypothetical protein